MGGRTVAYTTREFIVGLEMKLTKFEDGTNKMKEAWTYKGFMGFCGSAKGLWLLSVKNIDIQVDRSNMR